ncbi:universal stress protein [Sediminibacterium sp.]|uniref:universal stress protein n=1 Tax=Sediminibacterium sp. TaxID=1917865 RepID=UPI002718CB3B|nr:universal stress protein [Sediminibacterium sp.]MDO8997004.1 universal stress protein [Sediminibacterium sp.]MDP2422149.1 universal stress protein [Sediminibacterium sp.]
MKKIIVPTDFSVNSKSGVQFAIHWATQQKLELVFIHVLYVLRATRWSESYFEKYAAQEEAFCKIKFEKFISGIYRNMNVKPGRHSIIIVQGISPDVTIQDYCMRNSDIDYICISTRGAGKFKKIFGTNTGNLITKSPVPVLAVPKTYRISAIKNLLYATDFRNYSEELKKVVDFASPFKATVEVLHFTWPNEIVFDEKTIEAAFKKKYKYGLKIRFEKNDEVQSLIENLQNQIKIIKPSVVIMFTNQQRTLFQKIFLSSKAEELSFEAKVPLLVFNKE